MKSHTLLNLALCGGTYASGLSNRASTWTVGQTVKTSSGPVNGRAASVNTEVSVYLGIPYAVPPVDSLRWTAPKKFEGDETINATEYGPSCGAQLSYYDPLESQANLALANLTAAGLQALQVVAQFGDKHSEDCLTVNVWTKPQVGEAKKAVLVWIYGGGFNTGNSDSPVYDGQNIVEQEDVILVSLNYRLNILGFPGSLGLTQNLGLLDQRLAIEWVRDNIEAFGGDPTRITIFGQSAGAESVDLYSYAWTKDPIVSGLIQQSGNFLLIAPIKADVGDQNFNVAAASLGCTATSNGTSVIDCMRTKSYTDILKAVGNNGSLAFSPTVDETVVYSDYLNRSAVGNFIKAPVLLGMNNYEAGFFQAVATVSNSSNPDSYWQGFNLIGFQCPNAARANISISNKVPTWRYRYFGDFGNTRLTSVPDSGAYHGAEQPLIFDTAGSGTGIPANTDAEVAIGKYMRGAWAAFAKNPTSGLTTYGWPEYTPTSKSLVQLAYQNNTGSNLALGNTYDGLCTTIFGVTSVATNGTSNNGTSNGGSSSGGSSSGGSSTTSGTTPPPASATKSGAGKTEGSIILGLLLVVATFAL